MLKNIGKKTDRNKQAEVEIMKKQEEEEKGGGVSCD